MSTVTFDNVLLIGDSNLRYVGSFLPSVERIVAPGCIMWGQNTKNQDRLHTPLRQRLSHKPEVNIVLISLGTNNVGKTSPSEFATQVDELIKDIRHSIENCTLIFSDVLPQLSTSRLEIIDQFNDILLEKSTLVANARHISLMVPSDRKYWRDHVHLSDRGASVVADVWRDILIDEIQRINEEVCSNTSHSYSTLQAVNQEFNLAVTLSQHERRVHEMPQQSRKQRRAETQIEIWEEDPHMPTQGTFALMEKASKDFYERFKDDRCRREWMEEKENEHRQRKMEEEERRVRNAKKEVEITKARQSLRTMKWRGGCRRGGSPEKEREADRSPRIPTVASHESFRSPMRRDASLESKADRSPRIPPVAFRERSRSPLLRDASPKRNRIASVNPVSHHAQASTRTPDSKVICNFVECKKQIGKRSLNHFFHHHLPRWLRHGDVVVHMPYWAAFFRQIIDELNLTPLVSLHQKVLKQGWYPVNRSATDVGDEETTSTRMVKAFSEYLHVPPPSDFAETVPKSPTMLIHWRILRCLMQFGLAPSSRLRIKRMKKPPITNPDNLM